MNTGEIFARHYTTHEPVCLRWQDGRITSMERAVQLPPENFWLAPALMDVQVNGFGGVDFQQDDLQLADLLSATRQLQGAGIVATAILVNLIAAGVQASSLLVRIGFPFEHNGLFHLIQMVGIALLGLGLSQTGSTGRCAANHSK